MMRNLRSILCVIFMTGIGLFAQENESMTQDSAAIGTVTITRSGFRKDSKLEIRYRKHDRKIMGVTDNGKEIPENKFHKYEKKLSGALESTTVSERLPEFDDLAKRLDSGDMPDSVKLDEITSVLVEIDKLESGLARTYKGLFEAKQRMILLANLRHEILDALASHRFILKNECRELAISSDACWIDGERLSDEAFQIVHSLWQKYKERDLEPDEKTTIIFNE